MQAAILAWQNAYRAILDPMRTEVRITSHDGTRFDGKMLSIGFRDERKHSADPTNAHSVAITIGPPFHEVVIALCDQLLPTVTGHIISYKDDKVEITLRPMPQREEHYAA